jgi:hypothetical protein
LLPTIIFILVAYGLFALYKVFYRPQGGRPRRRGRRAKTGWLKMTAAGIGLGVLGGLCIWLPSLSKTDNLKMAGFLVLPAEGDRLAPKTDQRLVTPPLKDVLTLDQPAYALLHPETPAVKILPDKKAAGPGPLRKPKMAKLSGSKDKKNQAGPRAVKKGKAPSRAKTKKPASGPGETASARQMEHKPGESLRLPY